MSERPDRLTQLCGSGGVIGREEKGADDVYRYFILWVTLNSLLEGFALVVQVSLAPIK